MTIKQVVIPPPPEKITAAERLQGAQHGQAYQEWMSALDVLKDAIFLHDQEFRILRCNKAYQQCAGIPFDKIIGQPYYEVFPKTSAATPCCLRAMKKATAIAATAAAEEKVLVGDTSYRSRAFAIHDEQGVYLYSVHILEDISRHQHQEELTAALLELSTSLEVLDEKTLLQRGLDTVQRLTASRIGFLHFISEDQNEIELVTWSSDTLASYCTAVFDRHYPLSAAGIWVDTVLKKQPVIINDYPTAAGKKGLPAGHAPLQRFLSVPVFEGPLVRMIIGVGNAARDYDEHDVETLQLFSYDLYRIVQRKRAEAKLYEHGQELLFRNRIAQIFLTHSHDQIYPEVLKVILEATGSRFGIFGYLNDEEALVVPSMTQEIWDKCQIFGKAHVFPKATWSNSSWPRAILEKKTIYANEPACKTPEGHIAITRHISLPILFQDKVIGLFQVANKETDYSEADIQTLESLGKYLAPLLNARLEGKRAEEMITNILESIDEGFITINRDFEIISTNRAYAESVGSPLGEIIGRHCYKISHHIDQPCYLNGEDCAVKHVFDTGLARTTLHTHYDAAGQPIYVETKAFALQKNDLGEVQTAIEIVVDITDKKASEEEIHRLAFYDPLTRLPNRRLLLDRLQQAFISGDRDGQYGAVLFLDLDHFKTLNDTRGHAIGDLLLVEVAGRLQATVREGDTVSRQGGDEFVVLLKNLSEEKQVAITQAGHVAEKIRAVLGRPFSLAGQEQHITASIGISLFCSHDTTTEELFKHADTAMYQSKHSGRNTVRFFDPAMQSALEAASAMEADLRQAIQQGQFRLHYQPQTDSNGRIIGAEALLRWTHPGRGAVSPTAFIPLAEETGLILPIGHWVLEEACAQLKAWSGIAAATGLRLAVNVSARQFRQPDFVAEVRQVIAATGIDPASLKLELTESLVLMDVADTIAKMQVLGAMGIGFSMDDFGTGYSSLSQLKRLPLEQLKIDQSFIRDLGSGPHDAAIIETIIAMGRTLGFHVIAEGVETEEQLAFLVRVGCHAYQGYLFSRPVSAVDFQRLLEVGVIERS